MSDETDYSLLPIKWRWEEHEKTVTSSSVKSSAVRGVEELQLPIAAKTTASPQAWSSAFLFLQSRVNLTVAQ